VTAACVATTLAGALPSRRTVCAYCHQHSNFKPISVSPNSLLSLAAAPASWRRLDGSNSHTGTGIVLVSLLRAAFSIRCSGGPRLESLKAPRAGGGVARRWHRLTPLGCLKQRRRAGLQRGRWCTCYPASEMACRALALGGSVEFGTEGWTAWYLPVGDSAVCSLADEGAASRLRAGALDWPRREVEPAASMEAPRSNASSGGGETNGRTGA
jgi:hypothetical protein